jgi:hypothetical protein
MSALLERAWPPEFAIEKLITESSANVKFLPSAIERTRYVSAKRLNIQEIHFRPAVLRDFPSRSSRW